MSSESLSWTRSADSSIEREAEQNEVEQCFSNSKHLYPENLAEIPVLMQQVWGKAWESASAWATSDADATGPWITLQTRGKDDYTTDVGILQEVQVLS